MFAGLLYFFYYTIFCVRGTYPLTHFLLQVCHGDVSAVCHGDVSADTFFAAVCHGGVSADTFCAYCVRGSVSRGRIR